MAYRAGCAGQRRGGAALKYNGGSERPRVRIAVLVSGAGSNLQALIDATRCGALHAEIATVISDRPGVYALTRAESAGIATHIVNRRDYRAEAAEKGAAGTTDEVGPVGEAGPAGEPGAARHTTAPDAPMPAALPPTAASTPASACLSLHVPRPIDTRAHSAAVAARIPSDVQLVVLAGYLSIVDEPLLTRFAGRMVNLHPALLPRFGGPGMWGRHVHAAVLAAGEAESGCTVHLVDAGVDTGRILVQRRVPVLPGDTPETLAARIAPEEHVALLEALATLIGTPAETLAPAESRAAPRTEG